uniref:CENP-H domain-containing protein n=1 Tax=Bursaphelenchus xylophilus TaxID=6326 RepID=A0A1I7SHY6_BURXY
MDFFNIESSQSCCHISSYEALSPTEWLNQRIRILERELLVAEQLASAENAKKEQKEQQQASGQTTAKRKDPNQPTPQQQDLIGPDKWHTLTLVTQIKGQIEQTLRVSDGFRSAHV